MPSTTKIPIPDPTALGLLAYSSPGSTAHSSSSQKSNIKLEGLPVQERQIRQLNRKIDIEKQNLAAYAREKFTDEYHGDASAFIKGEQQKGEQGYFGMRQNVLAMEDLFLTNVSQAKRAKTAFEKAWTSAENDKALDQQWYDDYGKRRTLDEKGNIISEGNEGDKKSGYFTVGQWIKMGELAPLGAKTGLVEPYDYGMHYKQGTANENIDKMINLAKDGMREQLQSYSDGTIGTTADNTVALGSVPETARKDLGRQDLTELRDNFNRDFPAGLLDKSGKAFRINGKEANRDQQFDIYMTNYIAERAGLAVKNNITKPQPKEGSSSDGLGGTDKMTDEQMMQSPYWAQVMSDLQNNKLTMQTIDAQPDMTYGTVKKGEPSMFFQAPDRYTAEDNKYLYTENTAGVKSYHKNTNAAFPSGWFDATGTVHTGNELKGSKVLNFTGRIIYMPDYDKSMENGKYIQKVKKDKNGQPIMVPCKEYEISLGEDDWGHGTDAKNPDGTFMYYKTQAPGNYARKNSWTYGYNYGFGIDTNRQKDIENDLGGRLMSDDEYSSFSKTGGVSMYAIKAYVPMNPNNVVQGGLANPYDKELYDGAERMLGIVSNKNQVNRTREMISTQ